MNKISASAPATAPAVQETGKRTASSFCEAVQVGIMCLFYCFYLQVAVMQCFPFQNCNCLVSTFAQSQSGSLIPG